MKKLTKEKENIGFIGQGFIGANYALDFEERGIPVIRYSLDKKYKKNKEKIKYCKLTFIAVPTPTTPTGFDYSIVEECLKLIGDGNVAIIKSTILPGTTKKLQEKFPNIIVLHSPEFLTEKTAKKDASFPNRNIIGYIKERDGSYEAAVAVMKLLPEAPYKVILPVEEAEMIKYANNCWFYFKIIYMNLLYDLCKKTGVEFEHVKDAMSFDPRVGFTHLEAVHQGGRGAANHCFIKDLAAFKGLYKKMLSSDKTGNKLLDMIEKKNIELMIDTNKDIDLLVGVYGKDILKNKK